MFYDSFNKFVHHRFVDIRQLQTIHEIPKGTIHRDTQIFILYCDLHGGYIYFWCQQQFHLDHHYFTIFLSSVNCSSRFFLLFCINLINIVSGSYPGKNDVRHVNKLWLLVGAYRLNIRRSLFRQWIIWSFQLTGTFSALCTLASRFCVTEAPSALFSFHIHFISSSVHDKTNIIMFPCTYLHSWLIASQMHSMNSYLSSSLKVIDYSMEKKVRYAFIFFPS